MPTRVEPRSEFLPADEDEAVEIVRRSLRDSIPLIPFGHGRRKDYGNPCPETASLLCSRRLAGVIDYDPPNQVVTVGAGMTLGELQNLLAPNGQWLPVRPPLGSESTAGGIAALNACGPERLRYGSPRDLILGLRFVSGRGRMIKAGGKVIKNVAGYDLTRLLTGSAGTLGFLTGLTFRLAPLPEFSNSVRVRGTSSQCASAATQLLTSRLEPVFIVAAPEAGITGGKNPTWRLAAGFEGFETTVLRQTEMCLELLKKNQLGDPAETTYHYSEAPFACDYASLNSSAYLLRADVPVDKVERLCRVTERELDRAKMLLDFGCGRMLAGVDRLSDEAWTGICAAAAESGGHAILEEAPPEFKASHDVFGPARPEWKMMYRVKDALDPHHLFAPGRLPGRK